jgi:hypothetical protein
MVFCDKGPVLAMTDYESKAGVSGQNALLSLLSQEDFEGIRNQIHIRIRDDKIEENPAGEEAEDEFAGSPCRKALSDDEAVVMLAAAKKPSYIKKQQN